MTEVASWDDEFEELAMRIRVEGDDQDADPVVQARRKARAEAEAAAIARQIAREISEGIRDAEGNLIENEDDEDEDEDEPEPDEYLKWIHFSDKEEGE
jgi:hypothetical protein